MIIKRKAARRLILVLFTIILLMNIVAWFHALKFSRFDPSLTTKTKDASQLSTVQKIKTLFTGISNPRPVNKHQPDKPFETIRIKSNKEIECWLIRVEAPKGTVILFHGYSGEKSSMLDKAEIFSSLGYQTLLVDFMGSGGSEGNQTTLGFYEAEEVKSAVDYMKQQGETHIILFGTSMGAVAVMKAQSDYRLDIQSMIIECPFGSMLQTVEARFKTMGIPSFPMAELLVFWGGIQNGFNGFKHNPTKYALNISCPTLLMYGLQDEKVSAAEIDEIFMHLKGYKIFKTYPLARHENYLIKYKNEWTSDIKAFIDATGGNNLVKQSALISNSRQLPENNK